MVSIQDRWEEQQRLNLRQLLLSSGGCPSPFGLTDEGLCDFRGISVNESLHSLTIKNVDFSSGELGRGQFMASFQQCKFVELVCNGNLGENFIDCSFHKARLNSSVFYGKFVNCNFSNANLTGVRGRHIQFEGCNFENANLRKASFYDSQFSGCMLLNCTMRSGSLAGSSFEGCEINNFDFSGTVMERVKGLELQ